LYRARPLLITVAIAAAAWEAASRSGLAHPSVLPPLSVVLVTVGKLLRDAAFLADLGATARAVGVAYAITAPVAMAIGLALGAGGEAVKRITPFLYAVLAVPNAVFLPLFILVLGVTFLQKVVFAFTVSFFIICLISIAAVHSVDPALIRVARAFGASRRQLWLSVYVPSMAPVLLTALRYGLIFTTVGVLLSEMYGAREGVGPLIVMWGETFQMPSLIAGTFIVAAVTISANAVMLRAEHIVGHWRQKQATSLQFGT
jgi:ABC-type nitrate/sulfonate/bicarbonate transport system permease component